MGDDGRVHPAERTLIFHTLTIISDASPARQAVLTAGRLAGRGGGGEPGVNEGAGWTEAGKIFTKTRFFEMNGGAGALSELTGREAARG